MEVGHTKYFGGTHGYWRVCSLVASSMTVFGGPRIGRYHNPAHDVPSPGEEWCRWNLETGRVCKDMAKEMLRTCNGIQNDVQLQELSHQPKADFTQTGPKAAYCMVFICQKSVESCDALLTRPLICVSKVLR